MRDSIESKREWRSCNTMTLVTCALSRHGSFLLVDQLSYVSACTIATARIEAEAGGLTGRSAHLFYVQRLEVCVSVSGVFSFCLLQPSVKGRLYGISNLIMPCSWAEITPMTPEMHILETYIVLQM